MANITLTIPPDLQERMKSHPEIKWTEVIRQSIRNFLDDLEGIGEVSSEELRAKLGFEIPPPTDDDLAFAQKMVQLREGD